MKFNNSTGEMNCSVAGFQVPFLVLTVTQTVWIGVMALQFTVLNLSKQFPRQTRLLLLNLTLLDLLTSLTTVLVDSRAYLWQPWLPTCPKLQLFLIEFRQTAHMLTVSLLALDRIMSLVFAMRYQIHVTDNKTMAICFSVWVVVSLSVTSSLSDVLVSEVEVALTSDLDFGRYYILVGIKIFLLLCSVGGYLTVCAYMKSSKYLAGHTVPSFQTKSTSRILYSALLHSLMYSIIIFGTLYILYYNMCILVVVASYRVLVHLSYLTSFLLLMIQGRECRLLLAIVLCTCHRGWTEHLNRVRNELYAPYLKNDGQSTLSTVNITEVRDVEGLEFSITESGTTTEVIPLPINTTQASSITNPEIKGYNGNVF